MAKKYGENVTLVRNGVELNALVAASSMQPDGEHLTVLYLDPAFAGQMLGGSALERAVSTAFSVPLKEGAVNGWKDVAEVRSSDSTLLDSIMPKLTDLSLVVAEIDPEMEISPDGTLDSATALLKEFKKLSDAYKLVSDQSAGAYQRGHDAGYHAAIDTVASGESQPSAADLDAHDEVQKIAADTAGTDGTSPSDSAPADASVAAKEEPGDEREAPPAPPQQ